MKQVFAAVAAATLTLSSGAFAQTTVVGGSGTAFTNPGPSNMDNAACALSYDTWCARNVRNSGSVGQTTAHPRNGNGSLAFGSPTGDAKADYEYYLAPANTFQLSALQSMSYDYFRSSSSTVASHLVPALRVLIVQGSFSGSLVFEPIYNGEGTATVDAWHTESISSGTNLWLSQTSCGIQESYNITLGTWQSPTGSAAKCGSFNFNGNATVIGFSTGVGSGWAGMFDGAIDNVSFKTVGMNEARTFNFEVTGAPVSTVPEPSTYVLFASGLAGLAAAARARRKQA